MVADKAAVMMTLHPLVLPMLIDAVLVVPCLFFSARYPEAPQRIVDWALQVAAQGKTEAILRSA